MGMQHEHIGCIVGAFAKGPAFERIAVYSVQQFLDIFGLANSMCRQAHVQAMIYLTTHRGLYVTRVVADDARTAHLLLVRKDDQVVLENVSLSNCEGMDFSDTELGSFSLNNPGDWNNNIQMQLDHERLQIWNGPNLVESFELVCGPGPYEFAQLDANSNIMKFRPNLRNLQWGLPRDLNLNALFQGGACGSKPSAMTFLSAWELYADPKEVQIDFMLWDRTSMDSESVTINRGIRDICESRPDCYLRD